MTFKLLLHFGLPKTATSSLQLNVFHRLSQQQEINFLGRYKEPAYKGYYNPGGEIVSPLKNEVSANRLEKDRQKFEALLDKDKINVLSDEVYPISLSEKHDSIYKNIACLTYNCEVNSLLVLRNPADFAFSYYVEMYRWHYFFTKKRCFQAFLKDVIKNPNRREYDILFYDRIVHRMQENGLKPKVVFYEDLKHDRPSYFQTLSELMGFNADLIEKLFDAHEQNTRRKIGDGKYSQSLTMDQFFQRLIKPTRKIPLVKKIWKLEKVNSAFWLIMRLMANIPVTKAKKHTKECDALDEFLTLFYQENNFDYIADKNKLLEYDYLPKSRNT